MELKTFNDLPDIPDDDNDDFDDFDEEKPRPVLEEVRSLKKHVIPNYAMFIGRDRKAFICVQISAVSRKHAKVYEEDGIFYIQDLGSINGTYVNDKRVIDPAPLKIGDRIKIGVTKQYKNGVKEFEFKQNAPKPKKDVLKEELDLGIFSEDESSSNVLLKDCLCYITKKDLMSVLKSNLPRRVPLERISFRKEKVSFLSLSPYKVKEILFLVLKHPQFSENLKIQIRVTEIEPQEQYGILLHHCEIFKLTGENKKIFRENILLSPLICYMSSKIKDNVLEMDR